MFKTKIYSANFRSHCYCLFSKCLISPLNALVCLSTFISNTRDSFQAILQNFYSDWIHIVLNHKLECCLTLLNDMYAKILLKYLISDLINQILELFLDSNLVILVYFSLNHIKYIKNSFFEINSDTWQGLLQ